MISAIAPDREHDFIAVGKNGFVFLDVAPEKVERTPIIDPEPELPGNRFNDGRRDPLGGFIAGTMDNSESTVSGSFWRYSNGRAVKIDEGYHVTNGPAFSPDGGLIYLVDSAARIIFRAEFAEGRIENKEVLVRFGPEHGYPDGLDVDPEGCLWMAFWDGGCIRRLAPDGRIIATHYLPVPRPTSVALGGERLFVTSASIGLSDQVRTEAPLSGGVFAAPVRDLMR